MIETKIHQIMTMVNNGEWLPGEGAAKGGRKEAFGRKDLSWSFRLELRFLAGETLRIFRF